MIKRSRTKSQRAFHPDSNEGFHLFLAMATELFMKGMGSRCCAFMPDELREQLFQDGQLIARSKQHFIIGPRIWGDRDEISCKLPSQQWIEILVSAGCAVLNPHYFLETMHKADKWHYLNKPPNVEAIVMNCTGAMVFKNFMVNFCDSFKKHANLSDLRTADMDVQSTRMDEVFYIGSLKPNEVAQPIAKLTANKRSADLAFTVKESSMQHPSVDGKTHRDQIEALSVFLGYQRPIREGDRVKTFPQRINRQPELPIFRQYTDDYPHGQVMRIMPPNTVYGPIKELKVVYKELNQNLTAREVSHLAGQEGEGAWMTLTKTITSAGGVPEHIIKARRITEDDGPRDMRHLKKDTEAENTSACIWADGTVHPVREVPGEPHGFWTKTGTEMTDREVENYLRRHYPGFTGPRQPDAPPENL